METTRSEGVLQVRAPGTEWLATGWQGGYRTADAVYNVTVPDGFDRTDLDRYVDRRLSAAGFDAAGVALLTGVDQRHARGARRGPVAVVATAGLSNPAALPVDPTRRDRIDDPDRDDSSQRPPPGTVNVVVRTTRALEEGALATLLATVTEAKTATLSQTVGFTGTTSDAVVVGCDPDGDPADFAGSASTVGSATRACVREAVRASLAARYEDRPLPSSVADADHGVVTDGRADVFRP